MTIRFLLLALVPVAVACGGGGGGGDTGGGGGGGNATVFFAQDIQPIFDFDCISCHGTAGGLNLESWAGIDAGGDTPGGVVVPGDPENSLIIKRLEGTIMPQMPQSLPPLSAPEIETIKQWIREGALDN